MSKVIIPTAPIQPFDLEPELLDEPRETLGDRLYATIVEGIVKGLYPPDARLPSETALAQQFAVSRPIVREALARLRDHGLIKSVRGSGSWVRRRPDEALVRFAPVGSLADIQRCFEFRAAFESGAAALAAERHDGHSLARIETAFRDLEAIIQTREVGVDEDFAFHAAVAAAARNHFFTATLAMLDSHIRFGINLTRKLSLRQPVKRLLLVQEEHRRVLEAIARRDAATAARAMAEHIENARRRMFEGAASEGE
jgi:GntR family transcriptional repressor for pyruvate dehydrogenase complex